MRSTRRWRRSHTVATVPAASELARSASLAQGARLRTEALAAATRTEQLDSTWATVPPAGSRACRPFSHPGPRYRQATTHPTRNGLPPAARPADFRCLSLLQRCLANPRRRGRCPMTQHAAWRTFSRHRPTAVAELVGCASSRCLHLPRPAERRQLCEGPPDADCTAAACSAPAPSWMCR